MPATLLEPQIIPSCNAVVRVWSLPWPVVRQFQIRGVPEGETRGNHAHRTCRQIVQCPAGSFRLTAAASTDLAIRDMRSPEWLFAEPIRSLISMSMLPGTSVEIPPLHWIVMSGFSLDAVASVLCSEEYREGEAITDWEEFVKACG